MGPTPTVDLTEGGEEADELPDLEQYFSDKPTASKATKIPAPKPPKEAGFMPSSARSRGKPTPEGKGRGKRASNRGVGRGKTSGTFKPEDNPEAKSSEEEEEEEEDDPNMTKMEKIRKVLAKKNQRGSPRRRG